MNLRAFLKFFPKQVRKSADFCDSISERRDAALTTVRVATAVLSKAIKVRLMNSWTPIETD